MQKPFCHSSPPAFSTMLSQHLAMSLSKARDLVSSLLLLLLTDRRLPASQSHAVKAFHTLLLQSPRSRLVVLQPRAACRTGSPFLLQSTVLGRSVWMHTAHIQCCQHRVQIQTSSSMVTALINFHHHHHRRCRQQQQQQLHQKLLGNLDKQLVLVAAAQQLRRQLVSQTDLGWHGCPG